MLLGVRRIKQKAGRLVILSIGLLVLVCSLYLFSTFWKPLFVSPLAKDNTSQRQDIRILLTASRITFSKTAKMQDLSYRVDLASGISVFISSKKDLSLQVSSLQAILKQLTIEGKEAKSIDFRFDKPIILFK